MAFSNLQNFYSIWRFQIIQQTSRREHFVAAMISKHGKNIMCSFKSTHIHSYTKRGNQDHLDEEAM
jgi:hypothetical protein